MEELKNILTRIQEQAKKENIDITKHCYMEMLEEDITIDEMLQAIRSGKIIENYAEHKRGACCLINGRGSNRNVHIVCTTEREILILITVYEPKEPKWLSPTQRRKV